MIWHHPRYYKELKRIAKEEADKLASAQAPKLSNQPTQGSSPQAKGSSLTPKSTSSKIREPGYKRTS